MQLCQCIALSTYRELPSVGFLRDIANAVLGSAYLVPVNFFLKICFFFLCSSLLSMVYSTRRRYPLPQSHSITHDSVNSLSSKLEFMLHQTRHTSFRPKRRYILFDVDRGGNLVAARGGCERAESKLRTITPE